MVKSEDNLVKLLHLRALQQPSSTAYIWLQDGETESNRLSYRELSDRARAIASVLQSICKPGDRALLLYPSGLEFIAGFFGCRGCRGSGSSGLSAEKESENVFVGGDRIRCGGYCSADDYIGVEPDRESVWEK